MKVLTVVNNLQKGGTQRAAQNFCEAYAVLGHESKLLALYGDGPRKKELDEENIHVWIGFADKIKNEISSWKPDLIHLHSLQLKTEDVYTLRDLCPKSFFVETNVFSVPTKYSEILTNSFQLSEWCKYLYIARGGKKNKCLVVPNPVKVKNFYKTSPLESQNFRAKYKIPTDAFLFGRIGQSYYGKWSLYLIDLFKKFVENENPNSYLLIVNPPKEIVQYVSEKGLNDKVVDIEQLVSDEELRTCYSTIDVFLHIANQGESFGLVLAESLLCETPVITLNTPWGDNAQSEVVGNNIGGYCADSIADFYTFMKKLFLEKDLIKKLGSNGRAHIISNYDYLIVAQKCIDSLASDFHEEILYQPSNMKGIKELSSPLKPLIVFLLWVKLHNAKSHRLINFILKRLNNFDARSNYQVSQIN